MKKLVWLLAALLGGAVAVAVWVFVASTSGSRPRPMNISFHSAQEIHCGMRQEEVEAILGGPPGDYSHGIHDIAIDGVGEPEMPGVVKKEWRSDQGIITAGFDEQGVVMGVWASSGFLPGKTHPANGTAIKPQSDGKRGWSMVDLLLGKP